MTYRFSLDVEIEPFRIPNYVLPVEKMDLTADKEPTNRGMPSISIKELSPQMLSDLCDKFRDDIFAKAMKPDPKVFK